MFEQNFKEISWEISWTNSWSKDPAAIVHLMPRNEYSKKTTELFESTSGNEAAYSLSLIVG